MNKFNFSILFLLSICLQGFSQSGIYIEKISDTSLTKEQVVSGISLINPNPVNLYIMSNFDDTTFYAYVVIRDRFGNFVRVADSASWLSLDTTQITEVVTPFKQYECKLTRKRAFIIGPNYIVAKEPFSGTATDTLRIQMRFDGCYIRLIDSDKNLSIDTIKCMIGDSIILKTQGTPHDFPTSWSIWNAFWSVTTDSIRFFYQVPIVKDSSWICKPLSSGNGTLLVSLGGYMDKSIPISITPITSIHSNYLSTTNRMSISYCHGMLRISNRSKDIQSIRIFSLAGQALNKYAVTSNSIPVNLRNGVYIAKIQSSNTIFMFTVK